MVQISYIRVWKLVTGHVNTLFHYIINLITVFYGFFYINLLDIFILYNKSKTTVVKRI